MPAMIAMCDRLECDPLDLLAVAANESGCSSKAFNANGFASGLWQLMPATARGLGWDITDDPRLDAFRALPACEQLQWWERYFSPARGKLVNVAACYVWTFLPGLMKHASDPTFILCAGAGPYPQAYKANAGFDVAHKGSIIVQDLTDAARRACAELGQEWVDITLAFAPRPLDAA